MAGLSSLAQSSRTRRDRTIRRPESCWPRSVPSIRRRYRVPPRAKTGDSRAALCGSTAGASRARPQSRAGASLPPHGLGCARIRTTDRVLLLAVSVEVRPVVGRSCSRLWRCARPGPSTPDAAPRRAASGGGSHGCVSRNCYCFPGGSNGAGGHGSIQHGLSLSRPSLAMGPVIST